MDWRCVFGIHKAMPPTVDDVWEGRRSCTRCAHRWQLRGVELAENIRARTALAQSKTWPTLYASEPARAMAALHMLSSGLRETYRL